MQVRTRKIREGGERAVFTKHQKKKKKKPHNVIVAMKIVFLVIK